MTYHTNSFFLSGTDTHYVPAILSSQNSNNIDEWDSNKKPVDKEEVLQAYQGLSDSKR